MVFEVQYSRKESELELKIKYCVCIIVIILYSFSDGAFVPGNFLFRLPVGRLMKLSYFWDSDKERIHLVRQRRGKNHRLSNIYFYSSKTMTQIIFKYLFLYSSYLWHFFIVSYLVPYQWSWYYVLFLSFQCFETILSMFHDFFLNSFCVVLLQIYLP